MMQWLKNNWQALLISGLLALLATETSRADTYNFYFKPPPKKGKKEEAKPDVQVQSGQEDSGHPKAIHPLTSPAEGGSDEKRVPVDDMPPIIINNTNTSYAPSPTPAPAPVVAPEPVKVVEAPPAPTPSASSENLVLIASPPSPWRFGAGFNVFNQDPGRRTGDIKAANLGAAVSFGRSNDRGVGFNIFAGVRSSKTSGSDAWHIGGEFEFLPIRIQKQNNGLPGFEGGFMAGISTLAAHPDNLFSGHVGLRMNFNLNNHVGITVQGRSNLGYLMGEAGIVTRI